jgi:CRP/FNR family cyclic AMP-dependent transcriptional regulator
VSGEKVQRPRLIRILEIDPDLGLRLDDQDQVIAARQVVGELERLGVGPWQPRTLNEGKVLFGGLLLDGLVVREMRLGTTTSAELLGAGDVLLPSDADEVVPFVPAVAAWTVLAPTRVVWLDAPFAAAVRRWPQLAAAVLERVQRRADRLATTQAIAQLTRVDDRILALLWHLSERWGRMTSDGVVLPLRLTHRAIASLIGARRPSVTTAITGLERDGRIVRREDGGWLLATRPAELSEPAQKAGRSAWDEGRTAPASLLPTEDELPPGLAPNLRRLQVEAAQRAERTARSSAEARKLHVLAADARARALRERRSTR